MALLAANCAIIWLSPATGEFATSAGMSAVPPTADLVRAGQHVLGGRDLIWR
jgi:hypothetical protein